MNEKLFYVNNQLVARTDYMRSKRTKNYIEKVVINSNGDIEHKLTFSQELKDQNFRVARKKIFTEGFEPYKANVQYGIETETVEQHQEIIDWYNRMLDKDDSALENIPERIRYYISKEVE